MIHASPKAPIGTFIVAELLRSDNRWAVVGEPHESLEVAREMARQLNLPSTPELAYFVCDHNGIVPEKTLSDTNTK
jgi:phage terminase large subunit GpA-like protein